jgi:hypothetical protein
MMVFATDVANAVRNPPSVTPKLQANPSKEPHSMVQKRSSELLCSKSRRITGSDILLWLLKLPLDSPYRITLAQCGQLVGRIAWQSSTRIVRDHGDLACFGNLEDSLIVSIELPIVRRTFTLRSQKILGQWTYSFRVSRIVPDDSPIFKICATKDEATIRKLFDSGAASPFDHTASGVTLLHVRTSGPPELKLLMRANRLPRPAFSPEHTNCCAILGWSMGFARMSCTVNCRFPSLCHRPP